MSQNNQTIEVGDLVEVIDTFVVTLIDGKTGLHIYKDVNGVVGKVTEIESIEQLNVSHNIIHVKFVSSDVAGYETTIPESFFRILEKGEVYPIETLKVGSHVEFLTDVVVNDICLMTRGRQGIVKSLHEVDIGLYDALIRFDEPLGGAQNPIISGIFTEANSAKLKILSQPEDEEAGD